MMMHFDQDEYQRSLAKSMRMDKATNPQKSFKKILERKLIRFEENLSYPNEEEQLGRGEKKARKAEEKLKSALKDPKMGSLG